MDCAFAPGPQKLPAFQAKRNGPSRNDGEAKQDANSSMDKLSPLVFVLIVPVGNDLHKSANSPRNPHHYALHIDPGLMLEKELVWCDSATAGLTVLREAHSELFVVDRAVISKCITSCFVSVDHVYVGI